MRQALFALLLILAAFSGGALVNGPGLEWAREHLASLSRSLPGQQIERVDDPEGPTEADPDAPDPRPERPSSPLPVADASPFSAAPPKAKATPAQDFSPPDEPDPSTAFPVRAPRGPSIAAQVAPPSSPTSVPADLPKPPPSLLDSARLRLSDREIPVPGDETTVDADADSPPEPPADRRTPEVLWANASAPADPGEVILPGDVLPPSRPEADEGVRLASTSGPAEESADALEWAEVRRRMEELGVGRYWVEGQFGGPVVFRCVVPVIGDRAVSQHFEAEGNDLISAARVTLRRIALWRATEDTP